MGAGPTSLLVNVLLINIPQVMMSVFYFDFNALMTRIALVTEWDTFGVKAKGLRVSSPPRGAQRGGYFLQLPFRYSLPVLALSAVGHSDLSQGIFLVNLQVYGPSKARPIDIVPAPATSIPGFHIITTIGWSPLNLGVLYFVYTAMLITLICFGDKKVAFGQLPMAGSCSAAISAACHPGPEDINAWQKPVKWGVLPVQAIGTKRCSFSSLPVGDPVEGEMYA